MAVLETAFFDELRERVGGSDALKIAASDVARYTEDWRGRWRGAAACVVLPGSTRPGGGTWCGWPAPRRAGAGAGRQHQLVWWCGARDEAGPPPVIVNLARMRRIRSIDAANNSMDVEAGCVLAHRPAGRGRAGRLYPVSLGAEGSCQIGGNIATNAGGTSVLRYGNTRDNVLGLEVVLPDGRIWDGLYRLRKNNTGLRPEAPVHRLRRHAGHRHRRGAEAASAAHGARRGLAGARRSGSRRLQMLGLFQARIAARSCRHSR